MLDELCPPVLQELGSRLGGCQVYLNVLMLVAADNRAWVPQHIASRF
jgi:hypothetical protein